MRALLILVLTIVLAGCSMPVTTVRSSDTRPSISISTVHELSDLYVDGVRMGKAGDFSEPNRLRLEPGSHMISIIDSGRVLFQQKIYVESEHKNIIAK